MNPSETETRSDTLQTAAAAVELQQFLLCQDCRAAVDADQRYCVRCGARQAHASNPAVSYFAAAAKGRRGGTAASIRTGTLRAPVFGLFFVLLPMAVALGVLVGRSGSASDGKLIAALRDQKPLAAVATPSAGATGAATVTAATGSLPSTAARTSGFVVELTRLPIAGTDQAAATQAENDARAKGATNVGLINPSDFRATPDQGAGNYVVYAGQFKTRAEAEKTLARLKAHFPAAVVIAIAPVSAAGTVAGVAVSRTPAPVLAQTAYGTVHKIAGSKPTAQQVKQDQQVVSKINKLVGKHYVDAQKNLPDTIVVTGAPGSSPTPSTGAGQP